MNLDEIIAKAIPITDKDCRIEKARKEARRVETKKRILDWHKAQTSDNWRPGEAQRCPIKKAE